MKEGGSGAVTVAATAGDHRTASAKSTASRSATKSTAGDHRTAGSPRAAVPADDTNFEYDDNNEWDVGIGDLIIDLDNDIEKNGGAGGSRQTAATGAGGAGMGARTRDTAASSSSSSSSPSFDKGLKMKIKRTCKAGGNATDAKHEIVSSSESSSSSTSSSCSVTMTTSRAGNGADDPVLAASQSADDRTPVSAGSAAARRSTSTPGRKDKRAREPVVVVKTEQSENGETTSSVDAAHHGANSDDPTSNAKRQRRTSDSIEDALEVCVGTDDMISRGTSMDPDCLGPCEPGTSVNLQGIVWQETACGVLVVNITWRGKTYVGTLLDCTRQQEWAPPRFNDSPTAELDPRAAKARAKRGRGADMAGGMAETRSGKLRGGGGAQAKGRRTTANSGAAAAFTAPPSPARRKGRGAGGTTAVDSPLSSSELQQRTPGKLARGGSLEPADSVDGCDQPGLLIECPEPNCSKKYRHANGLRYHQSHAHQNGPTASPVSVSSTAQDGEVKVKVEQPATSPGVAAATPAVSAPSPLPDLKKPLKMEDVGIEDVEAKPTPSRIPAVPVVSSIGLTLSRPASPAASQKRVVQEAGVAGPALHVMVHPQPTAAASQDSSSVVVGNVSVNQRQSPLVASIESPLAAAPAGVGRVGCPVPAELDKSASAVDLAVGVTAGESIESSSSQPAVVGVVRAMVASSHQPPVSPSLAAADLQHRTASPAYSDISDDSQPSSSDHVGVGPVVTSAVPPTGLVKPQPMAQRPTPPPAVSVPAGVFYHHHPYFQPTAEPAAASAVVTSPHWRKQQSVAPPAPVRPASAADRSPSSGAGRVGSPGGAEYGAAGRVPFYTYPYHLAAAAGYPTAAGGPPPSVPPPQPPVSSVPPMPPQPGGAFALSGLLDPSRYKPPAATPPRDQLAGRTAGLTGSPVVSSTGGRVTLASSTGTTAGGGASPLSRPPAAAGRVNSPTSSRDSDASRRTTPFAAYPSPYGLGPAAAMPPYPSMLLGAPAFHHAAAAANAHHPRFPGLPEDLSRVVAGSGYPSVEALAASGFYPRPPPPPPAPTAALGSSRTGGKETTLLEAQRASGRTALTDPQRTYQPVQPAPPNPQPYAGVPVSVPSATFAPIK